MNLEKYIQDQIEWSIDNLGPYERTSGLLKHISKELIDVEKDPHDTEEWIDIIILAIDGAWRHGATPEQIAETLNYKQWKNKMRSWPDWRNIGDDNPIEHVRD